MWRADATEVRFPVADYAAPSERKAGLPEVKV